jgi:hypothetical protein
VNLEIRWKPFVHCPLVQRYYSRKPSLESLYIFSLMRHEGEIIIRQLHNYIQKFTNTFKLKCFKISDYRQEIKSTNINSFRDWRSFWRSVQKSMSLIKI